MNARMRLASMALLGGVTLCHSAIAGGDDAQKERVKASCPGVAAWERGRTPAVASTKAPANPVLQAALIRMAAEDQQARHISPDRLAAGETAALENIRKVDARNLAELRKVIEKHDVPTVDTVGSEGMSAFWILVQHADGDPSLQQRVLAGLSTDPRGIPPNEIAMLTDRVQVNRGEPQTYGTQFHREKGKFVPDTIRDADGLAERRRRMDLMPLDDYECVLRTAYGQP